MKIIHHGGKHTVTGSCHELQLNTASSLLIDCGLMQGNDVPSNLANGMQIDFPINHIQALILTHTHIDHIGRLPWLLAAGFRGPIYATKATAQLAPLMIADGLKIQGELNESEIKGVVKWLEHNISPLSYGEWHHLEELDNCKLRLQQAGHIIGSAYVEIEHNDERIVFSGDLGPCNTPLLPDPKPPQRADYLFIETTYGDKKHESPATRKERLLKIIKRSLKDNGVILIPAFSVGRTQELLYDLESLIAEHKLEDSLPIILDSPMAAEVTTAYRQFKALWSEEAKNKLAARRKPLAFDQCLVIESHREHLRVVNRLASTEQAAIIIAASGMCQGGRIMNYLQKLLPKASTDIIFCGFQAPGTLGERIQRKASSVEIDNAKVVIRAQSHSISGYSAHADQEDLRRFIAGVNSPIKELHLIHGTAEKKAAFKASLKGLNIAKIL